MEMSLYLVWSLYDAVNTEMEMYKNLDKIIMN